jgi:hypothetical protein
VPAEDLAELARLREVLDDPGSVEMLAAARRVLAISVARHEAQHRSDYARAEALAYPSELEAIAGPLVTRFGAERGSAVKARDELSAYLASLARERVTPRLELTLIARFIFDHDQWGAPEHAAAIVIFEGLRRELDLPGEPIVDKGVLSRRRAADLYLAITEEPPWRVRAAAERLWEHLYGVPLPEISER